MGSAIEKLTPAVQEKTGHLLSPGFLRMEEGVRQKSSAFLRRPNPRSPYKSGHLCQSRVLESPLRWTGLLL